MTPLQSELSRLHFANEFDSPNGENSESDNSTANRFLAADGWVRAMVLELARPADWNSLATVWRGVQTDLALPEPAIAVNGVDGHQLWFSLAAPFGAADARAFLEALRLRYLGTVEPRRIGMSLGVEATVAPALQAQTGLWSAFVSSDLAGIFTDEPWLDLAPNPDAQARLLSRLECIQPSAFQAVLDRIKPTAKDETTQSVALTALAVATATRAPSAQAPSLEPKRFLLDVMADPSVDLHLRIEAAKALLPYCGDRSSGESR